MVESCWFSSRRKLPRLDLTPGGRLPTRVTMRLVKSWNASISPMPRDEGFGPTCRPICTRAPHGTSAASITPNVSTMSTVQSVHHSPVHSQRDPLAGPKQKCPATKYRQGASAIPPALCFMSTAPSPGCKSEYVACNLHAGARWTVPSTHTGFAGRASGQLHEIVREITHTVEKPLDEKIKARK